MKFFVGGKRRSRYGYDSRWWGESPLLDNGESLSYWERTRRPATSLVFILPLLFIYEVGLTQLQTTNQPCVSFRAGADDWIRAALIALGMKDKWFSALCLPLFLFVAQVRRGGAWSLPPITLPLMVVESILYGLGLMGLSHVLDVAFDAIPETVLLANGRDFGSLLTFIGAGLYEEAFFRLALIPTSLFLLRCLQTPNVLAGTIAITTSSVCFSLAHHAGSPGEEFTWYVFIFRWAAGVYFSGVFLGRGIGVAIGTHVAYDVVVGWTN